MQSKFSKWAWMAKSENLGNSVPAFDEKETVSLYIWTNNIIKSS